MKVIAIFNKVNCYKKFRSPNSIKIRKNEFYVEQIIRGLHL